MSSDGYVIDTARTGSARDLVPTVAGQGTSRGSNGGLIAYLRSSANTPVNRLMQAQSAVRTVVFACIIAVWAGPIIAVVRAQREGLRPIGDTALMALKMLDVGTSATPLIGQQTSVIDSAVRHPGPLQFWLFAPFVRVFGSQSGFAIATALVACVCFSVAVWIAYRSGGMRLAVLMTGGVLLIQYTFGYVLLSSAVSSAHGLIPSFAALVVVAAVLRGDLRLLPLAVGVGSYAFQTHLAMMPMALAFGAAVIIALVVHMPAAASRDGWWRSLAPVGRAIDVGLVLWIGPLIDQLFGERNLVSMLSLGAGGTNEPGRGAVRARALVDWVMPPGSLVTKHFTPLAGSLGYEDLFESRISVAWLSLVIVLIVALLLWRRCASSQLAVVALLAVAASSYAAAGLSARAELKANNYAWIWIVSVLLVVTVADWLSEGAQAIAFAVGGRARQIVAAAAAPATAVIVVAGSATAASANIATYKPAITEHIPTWSADLSWGRACDKAATTLAERFKGMTLMLRSSGFWSGAFVVPALALGLEEHGVRYYVDVISPSIEAGYGKERSGTRTGLPTVVALDYGETPNPGSTLIDVLLNLEYLDPPVVDRVQALLDRPAWTVTPQAKELAAVADKTTDEQLWEWALRHPESAELLGVANAIKSRGMVNATEATRLTRDDTWDPFRTGRVVTLWLEDPS